MLINVNILPINDNQFINEENESINVDHLFEIDSTEYAVVREQTRSDEFVIVYKFNADKEYWEQAEDESTYYLINSVLDVFDSFKETDMVEQFSIDYEEEIV